MSSAGGASDPGRVRGIVTASDLIRLLGGQPGSAFRSAATMSDAYELLRAQRFLDGLSDRQLQRLARCAVRSMFHAGNRVFREGDPADRMWLIVTGQVALDTELPALGEVVVDTLGPGAVLGWSWLVPPHRWQFGAVAIETTQTVEMDGPAARELCHSDPQLGFQLALGVVQVVTERLRATRQRLATRPI